MQRQNDDIENYLATDEDDEHLLHLRRHKNNEEEHLRLLRQNKKNYDETTYTGEYGFYNLIRTFGHFLQKGTEAAINNLMTFITWFPQLIAQFGFIFLFPIVMVPAGYLYNLGKILLNPLIDWKHKTVFLSAITTATALIMAPLVSNFFLEFLEISFIGFIKAAMFAPFFFTGAMAIYTGLTAYGLARSAYAALRDHLKGIPLTPLAKLTLVNKLVKTGALATITAVIIPLMLALGTLTLLANPFTAGPAAAILFSVLMAASATMITMKIVKTIAKHRLQEKMAYEALEGVKDTDGKITQQAFNPYALLKITQAEINMELGKPRLLGFLNKRDLKIVLHKRFVDAQTAIAAEGLPQAEKNAKLYQLKLSYEMVKHPRGREMFDAFKTAKELRYNDNLPSLKDVQKQFGVVSNLQKTIPVSWLMRPIAWTIYQIKKRNAQNPEDLALCYRVATNKALGEYYEKKREGFARQPTSPATEFSPGQRPTGDRREEPTQGLSPAVTEASAFGKGKRSPSSQGSAYANGFTTTYASNNSHLDPSPGLPDNDLLRTRQSRTF